MVSTTDDTGATSILTGLCRIERDSAAMDVGMVAEKKRVCLILGSSGNDVIRVHELLASDSIEVIDGGGGVNRIEGTDQADTIDLSSSTVSNISGVYGGIGNDTLIGTSGQDYLYGGADNLPCFFGR